MKDAIEKILIRVPKRIKVWVTEKSKMKGISVNALLLQMLWEKYEEEKEDHYSEKV